MSGRSEAVSLKVRFSQNAPAHRLNPCAGVFVLICMIAGCEKPSGVAGHRSDRSLELTGDTIELAAGITLHDVAVKSAQNTDFNPAQMTAKVGDVVRFTVADTRTHALVITAPSEAARKVLEAGGQLRSPPLVAKGQAWVVSLQGIPPGTYTISCISHAGTANLVVE